MHTYFKEAPIRTFIFLSLLIFITGTVVYTYTDQRSTEVVSLTESSNPDSSDFLSMRTSVDSLVWQSVSAEEREDLLYMREEEKLARDVYRTMYDLWGINVFINISRSEETHTEAVRNLLVKYQIPDPVQNDSLGTFKNADLLKLYTDLTKKGGESAIEALKVGALIEDLDIKDLEIRIARTDNDDIKLVYENLMKGSRNHLRSFVSQLSARGSSYTPSYISQDEFNSIIGTPRETGSSGGRGQRNR